MEDPGFHTVHTNRYSVDEAWIGRRLPIHEHHRVLRISDGHRLVLEHDKRDHGAGQRVIPPEHRRRKPRRPEPSLSEEGVRSAAGPELTALVEALRVRHGGRAAKAAHWLHRNYLDCPTEARRSSPPPPWPSTTGCSISSAPSRHTDDSEAVTQPQAVRTDTFLAIAVIDGAPMACEDGLISGTVFVGQEPTIPPDVGAELRRHAAQPLRIVAPPPTGVLRPVLGTAAPPLRQPVATDAVTSSLAGARLMDVLRERGPDLLRGSVDNPLDTIRASLRGTRTGPLELYVKRPLQGFRVRSDVRAAETLKLEVARMGGRTNEVALESDQDRKCSLSFASQLGAGKDFVRVTVSDLPVAAARVLRAHVQPGLTGIDVVTAGVQADVRVIVDGQVDGRPIAARFRTAIDGATRFALPDRGNPSHLKLSSIDRLRGEPRESRMLVRED